MGSGWASLGSIAQSFYCCFYTGHQREERRQLVLIAGRGGAGRGGKNVGCNKSSSSSSWDEIGAEGFTHEVVTPHETTTTMPRLEEGEGEVAVAVVVLHVNTLLGL